MNFHDFEFGRFPAAILLLGIFPIIGLIWYSFYAKSKALHEIALLPNLIRSSWTSRSSVQGGLYFIVWIFATIALMDPRGEGHYPSVGTTLKVQPQNVFLLIDASASMGVKDMQSNQSRLEYAKRLSNEIARQLKGQMIAVSAFTSELTTLSPLTTDYFFVRIMLNQLELNEGGIAGTQILKSLNEFNEKEINPASAIPTSVIMFSDGGDTTLDGLSQNDVNKQIEQIRSVFFKHANLRLISIGVGSLSGEYIPNLQYQGQAVHSVLEESLLKSLAEGIGEYYRATDWDMIQLTEQINKKIGLQVISSEELQSMTRLIYRHYFQFPLAIALIALLVMVRYR